MSHNPKVAVVLSSYNGAPHIEEQIESVLMQTYPNLHLYIRDDGSSDGTSSILARFKDDPRVTCVLGQNEGVVQSFFHISEIAANDCDYLAFCDQDDLWFSDKISRAVSKIKSVERSGLPVAYCSEYFFCDGNLNRVNKSHLNNGRIDFERCLFENKVSGNTLVINRPLINRYLSSGCKDVSWHDWWIALIAYALGDVIFDDYCSLDYRRTGDNVSPTGSGFFSLLNYRLNYFFKSGYLKNVTAQLNKLLHLYGSDLDHDKLEMLKVFTGHSVWRKAFMRGRLREKISEELSLRMLFLFGCL